MQLKIIWMSSVRQLIQRERKNLMRDIARYCSRLLRRKRQSRHVSKESRVTAHIDTDTFCFDSKKQNKSTAVHVFKKCLEVFFFIEFLHTSIYFMERVKDMFFIYTLILIINPSCILQVKCISRINPFQKLNVNEKLPFSFSK